MGAAKDPVTGVTPQQEIFCRAIAFDGLSQSDAYRLAYNVSSHTSPAGIAVDASTLAATPNVSLRVQQLKASLEAKVLELHAWDLDRMVSQAEKHMEIALQDHPRRGPNVSAANGALEIIGRATGLLSDRSKEPAFPVITRVVVVLNHGRDAEGAPRRVVEAAYEVKSLAETETEVAPGVEDNLEGP